MDFNQNIFGGFSFNNKKLITPDSKIVFVSDMFAADYTGGAELTFQALIDSCPTEYDKVHAKDVTIQVLEEGLTLEL